jgi:hypothetical protein
MVFSARLNIRNAAPPFGVHGSELTCFRAVKTEAHCDCAWERSLGAVE